MMNTYSFKKMRGPEKPTLYISGDCESLGGHPDRNYVFSWGFAAATEDGQERGALHVNLAPPPGTEADPDTLAWFQSTEENRKVYAECTRDPVSLLEGMTKIRTWISAFYKDYKPVLVFYPTVFDGTMLYLNWYRALGHPSGGKGPGFTAIDIRSYAAARLGISIWDTGKTSPKMQPFMPKDLPHTHNPLDDAREQLHLFLNLMRHK